MTRPRNRRILVFSQLEHGMGATLFVLNSKRFHARGVHTVRDMRSALDVFSPEAALLFYDGWGSETAVRSCEALCHDRGLPVLLVCRKPAPENMTANAVLAPKAASMTEIVYGLGTLLTRKRGPRPCGNSTQGAGLGPAAEAVSCAGGIA
jgi:hypothetical protein